MTIYFYWGEDDFAIARAIASLRDRTLDPHWTGFNYEKFLPIAPMQSFKGWIWL